MPVASPDGTGAHCALMKIQNISVCRPEDVVHPDQDLQPFSAPFYIMNLDFLDYVYFIDDNLSYCRQVILHRRHIYQAFLCRSPTVFGLSQKTGL
jgi:hypothetical protein